MFKAVLFLTILVVLPCCIYATNDPCSYMWEERFTNAESYHMYKHGIESAITSSDPNIVARANNILSSTCFIALEAHYATK